jgi:hypothetical protein
MRRAVNALYIADTIGQMADQGVAIANQWNLANGVAENGTDYGLVDLETNALNLQYYALALWQRFGDELLAVRSPFPADSALSVYAGRAKDGTIALLAINKSDQPIQTTIQIDPARGRLEGLRDWLQFDSPEGMAAQLNGVTTPVDLADAPAERIAPFDGPLGQRFEPYSITLVRLSETP